MSDLNNLTSNHIDLLRELGNIGAGNAITALSKMLGHPINVAVPHVNMVDFKDVATFIGGPENIITGILVNISGDVNGIMMFILNLKSAHILINDLLNTLNEDKTSGDFSEMELSALREIGNIVASSYLGSLSSIINKKITPSIPYLSIDMANAILSVPAIEFSKVADKVILIESVFNTKINENVSGYFVLVPDAASFEVIFSLLG